MIEPKISTIKDAYVCIHCKIQQMNIDHRAALEEN